MRDRKALTKSGFAGSALAIGAVCVGVATGAAACPGRRTATTEPPPDRKIGVAVISELRGQLEPCGCTTDPLGDVSRIARWVRDRGAPESLVVLDGGSTLYASRDIRLEAARDQASRKGALIDEVLHNEVGIAASGLGAFDLTLGPDGIRYPRHVSNLSWADGPVRGAEVIERAGVRVGVFGIVGGAVAARLESLGHAIEDAATVARREIAALRQQRADVVVALVAMDRRGTAALVQAVDGLDFAVVGEGAPEPAQLSAPVRVGDTWIVQGANRGQVLWWLELGVRGRGPFTDAIGADASADRLQSLEQRERTLAAQLATWEADPQADPEFIARKRSEKAAISSERAALVRTPTRIPDSGNWFMAHRQRIHKGLPCAPKVETAKKRYDAEVSRSNLEAARDLRPPAVAEGEAGYAGLEECSYCHKEAVAFWRKTRHAGAWKTLTDRGKAFDYSCTGCHVTGWERPGGTTLAFTEGLVDVQCEVCHGPASVHVDADGNEQPSSLVSRPDERVCGGCHTPEHSDTFDFRAYLRDVTGVGHGEAYRRDLGDGPTGAALRQAGRERAGSAIGVGCSK